MRNLRKVLALVLTLSMLMGLCMFPAAAAGESVTVGSRMEVVDANAGVYKLVLDAVSPNGLSAFEAIISYDNTVIRPVNKTGNSSLTITDGASETRCFNIVLSNMMDGLYAESSALWKIIGSRTAFQYGVNQPSNYLTEMTDKKDIYEFYFKLAPGKSLSDLNQTTFKIETDKSAGSLLAAFYVKEALVTANSISLAIKDITFGNLAGSNKLTAALTYDNNDVQVLTDMVLSMDQSEVAVAKDSQTVTATLASTDAFGADMPTPSSGVTYSFDPAIASAGVTYNNTNGAITVTKDAQAGTVKVKATSGGVISNEVEIAITRDAAVLTEVTLDEATINIAGTSGENQTATATAYDQFGTAMTEDVSWTITAPQAIDRATLDTTYQIDTNGVIIIGNGAPAGVYTVTASTGDGTSAVAALTVTRATSTTGTVTVSGAPSLTIPGATETTNPTATFTATVTDQFGDGVDNPTITWSMAPVADGVSISDGGVFTVTHEAKETIMDTTGKEFTVTAQSGTVSGTAKLTIKRDTATPSSIVIYRGETALTTTDTVVKPVTGGTDKTYNYTTKVLDQYGTEMTDQNATLAASNSTDANITFADNTLTVKAAAAKDATITLTASLAAGFEKTVTVKITDLDVNWTGITPKVSPVYGDTNAAIMGTLPTSGTADAGGTTVSGTFTVKDASTIQAAGASKTVTVLFTGNADAGEYANVEVTKDYTVTIEKKPITVAAENKTKVYGEENPALTLNVPANTLVGDDTNDALSVTLTCTATTSSPAGTPVAITGTSASDNYEVTVTAGTLTITTATMTGFQTDAPTASIFANNAKNTDAATVKGAITLPATVTVTFKDGTAELPITWAAATEAFNAKGGTYTYKGTVTAGSNFASYTPTLDAVLTVTPVTGTIVGVDEVAKSTLATPVSVAVGKLASATAHADFKLPASVQLSFTGNVDPITFTKDNGLTYSETVATLKGKTVNSTTPVTIGFPAWITVASGTDLTVNVKITAKYPVTVTVTQEGGTYGTVLAAPVPSQAAIDDGTDTYATYTYLYEGTTAAGTKYSSATKPTDAGTYTVTATLVSTTHDGSGKSAPFTITPKSISGVSIELPASYTATYNTTAHEPVVTVKDGDNTLAKDKDYTVTYSNNIAAGTATISIVGKWNYNENKSATFTIAKASIAAITPTIAGKSEVGQVLSATLPNVSSAELDWAWYRGTAKIDGATGPSYELAGADAGAAITVKAVAKETNYTGTSQISTATNVAKLAATGTVSITETNGVGTSGTIDAGDTLSAVITGILPAEAQTGLTYQWYRGTTAIPNATQNAYTVTAGDASAILKVIVTPNTAKFTGTFSSSVEVGKRILSGTLTLSGGESNPTTGTVLTAVTTELAPNDSSKFDLVWMRDGVVISGATATTYTITAADLGKTITVKATGKGDSTGEILCTSGVSVAAKIPGVPTLNATAGNAQVTLNWTAPPDNGAPIIKYTLTVSGGNNANMRNANIEFNPITFQHTVTGLQNGVAYAFTLTATNRMGESTAATVTATPVAPPTRPSTGTEDGGFDYTQGTGSNNNTSIGNESSGGTTTVTVKPTVSGNTASATVSERTVTNAIAEAIKSADKTGNDANIVLNINAPSNATTVKATIPVSALTAVAKSDVDSMTITSNAGEIALDNDAIAAIADQSGRGSVTISLGEAKKSSLNASQREIVGDAPVFDISIKGGKGAVTSFDGGSATITIPYELKDGQKVEGIEIWYLDDEGNIEPLETKYNARTGLVTFITPHLSYYVIGYNEDAAWTNPFLDVADADWFFGAVRYASMNGLFNGTSDNLFSPNAAMNRAMLVTVLWRYEGEPAGAVNIFTDVEPNAWYTNAVTWAAANGIVAGVGEGKFAPNQNITREQIAAILYRYAQKKGIPFTGNTSANFSDMATVSDWASDGVLWAVRNGLLTGKGNGLLAPSATASRAEVATMIQRFVAYSNR